MIAFWQQRFHTMVLAGWVTKCYSGIGTQSGHFTQMPFFETSTTNDTTDRVFIQIAMLF